MRQNLNQTTMPGVPPQTGALIITKTNNQTKYEIDPSPQGAIKGAAAGASVGAIFGPAGAVVGGVIGGVIGGIFG